MTPVYIELPLPQISINGTNKTELVSQQLAVIGALRLVSEAMTEAAPNGRDYQYRPDQLNVAIAAWTERQAMIVNLRRDLEKHAEAIDALPGK